MKYKKGFTTATTGRRVAAFRLFVVTSACAVAGFTPVTVSASDVTEARPAGVSQSQSQPSVSPAHDATSNGCTTPVYVPIFNNQFHAPCDTHDHCYNQKWYGNSLWGKSQCDLRFYREMLATCPWWNSVCRSVASTYYLAVSGPGGLYAWYNSSWFH